MINRIHKIHRKQMLIAAAAVLGLVGITTLGLLELRSNMLEDRREQVRSVVEVVHGVLGEFAVEVGTGEMDLDEAQRQAAATVGSLRFGDEEYFWISDTAFRMVVHPLRPDLNGQDISQLQDSMGKNLGTTFAEVVRRDGAGFVSYLWPKMGSAEPVAKVSYVKGFRPWGWIVGSGIYVDDVNAVFWRQAKILGTAAFAFLLVVTGISWWVSRSITRPMASITASMSRLSAGDTSVPVAFTDRADEMGDLARAMDVFKQNMLEIERLRNKQEHLRENERATLRESEETMRSLLESAAEGIYGIDTEGTIIFCNPACRRLLGYSQTTDLKGKSAHDLVHGCGTTPDRSLCGRCGVCDAHEMGSSVHVDDQLFWRTDGSPLPVEYRAEPMYKDGKIIGGVVSFTDVSERRRAEAEIVRLNHELERRVAKRTADLAAANEELEAFTYSVSHDLRSPLRTIRGFSEILLDTHGQELSSDAQHLISRIGANVDKLDLLVSELLKLSRSSRGDLKFTAIDLSAIVRTVAAGLKESNPARKAAFEIASEVSCEGDPEYLRVVLENLLGNAWKYTSGKNPAEITFGVANGSPHPIYFVKDNGAGFDMSYAHQLFQPFKRLHGPDEFEGNGIGLATVERIISRHGGRIWAEAEVGKGATFHFTLGQVS